MNWSTGVHNTVLFPWLVLVGALICHGLSLSIQQCMDCWGSLRKHRRHPSSLFWNHGHSPTGNRGPCPSWIGHCGKVHHRWSTHYRWSSLLMLPTWITTSTSAILCIILSGTASLKLISKKQTACLWGLSLKEAEPDSPASVSTQQTLWHRDFGEDCGGWWKKDKEVGVNDSW